MIDLDTFRCWYCDRHVRAFCLGPHAFLSLRGEYLEDAVWRRGLQTGNIRL